MTARQVRAQYTQEFKMEAVRQVRGGQAIAVVAKVLGITQGQPGQLSSQRGQGRFERRGG
jgi:transposase